MLVNVVMLILALKEMIIKIFKLLRFITFEHYPCEMNSQIRVLGIPRNSNLFQDMQMSKDKKPWNFGEYLGMGENSSWNFGEFLGILNNSKNFKVAVKSC